MKVYLVAYQVNYFLNINTILVKNSTRQKFPLMRIYTISVVVSSKSIALH